MIPATPYLHLDLARLQHNLDRIAEVAATAGVALRPHAKTHKCPEVAARQLAAGAHGLTVATVGEAEVFAEHGVTDLFIGYPLWLDQPRAQRLLALAERAVVGIGVDSVSSGRRAAELLAGATSGRLYALIEVDSGHHRTGVPPNEAGEVAAATAAAGLEVRGVFTFPGHSYSPAARASAAQDEAAALRTAAASLAAEQIEPLVVSGGSTPSLAFSGYDDLTEIRPGVYVFGDAQQWELGVVEPADIALTCRTTVVSRQPGRYVVDAGSKALGADRADWASGFGRVLSQPEDRIVSLSEHHAVIETQAAVPDLGSIIDVVPNHVCNAVNLADFLYAESADGTVAAWPVAARGRNS